MAEFSEKSVLADKARIYDFACKDWFERLKAGRSPIPDLPLDEARADQAVRIFDKLRLPDVDGNPPLADACGPWFRDIVRVAFGAFDEAGARRVSEIFALVGKKNSKTTYSAGLMLTLLLVNKVPRAEILFVGPTQEIADTAFQQVVGMIEEDDEGYLQQRFQIQDHKKKILDRVTKAFIKIKTFDMKVMTGSKPLIVLLDELHVMGSIHFASRVLRQIRGALVRRTDSLLLMITTQSDEEPAGVFRTELAYARAVRDGEIRDHVRMLPILFEFPKDWQLNDDKPWADPKNWHVVMPNLGRSLHLDSMVADFATERRKGKDTERLWASQHLNVQIGLALHSGRWRGADYWEAACIPLTLDELLARSEVCTIGIDGGGLDDLLGVTVMGRDAETKAWLSWSKAWCQSDVLSLRKDIAPRLEDFADAAELVFCKEPTDDIFGVADVVEKVFMTGLLPEKNGVGIDPQGVSALVDELAGREIHTTENNGPVTGVSQGYRLSPAIWGAARKLKDGTLRPADQSIAKWCVGNAKEVQRGNAVVIDKQTAGKAKIDVLISLLNAFMLMARNPEASGSGMASYFESLGAS